VKSRISSQRNETFLVMSVRPGKKFGFQSAAENLQRRDDRTDSGKLFMQTDAAVAGKMRSPMVERTVRGATSADVVEERSRRRALRCDTR